MRKKWMVLCLSLGIIAFGAATIHGSVTTGNEVAPVAVSEQVVKASLQSSTSVTPEVMAGGIIRLVIPSVAKAMRSASMFAGAVVHTSQDSAIEQIFDK
ncbi:hypothetical protein [Paenibacillus popilliae]|uniref:GMP synthase n=1 Tax=Paenibacillus popilliae ATCC 14706 TaxID=1212764 RepID=M9LHH3_PAEPP|nr:hypothetical protein [Paenibacillus popilliae]GAC42250.1 GMP synthase [Paenibacillus popilliae ATCC 14706]